MGTYLGPDNFVTTHKLSECEKAADTPLRNMSVRVLDHWLRCSALLEDIARYGEEERLTVNRDKDRIAESL